MVEYVGRFYRRLNPPEARRLERGHLCMAPIFYLDGHRRALRHADPAREERSLYRVVEEPDDIFKHPPVHEIRLRRDEELLATRAKRRPVVVAGLPATWPPGEGRLRERSVICLPVYSFHEYDTAEFRARVGAIEYPPWIPFPPDAALGLIEGFIRLDRMQTIEQRHLERMDLALTESAERFVSEWTRYHLTGQIDPIWLEIRAELVSQFQARTSGDATSHP